jgi:hypothetical protein
MHFRLHNGSARYTVASARIRQYKSQMHRARKTALRFAASRVQRARTHIKGNTSTYIYM